MSVPTPGQIWRTGHSSEHSVVERLEGTQGWRIRVPYHAGIWPHVGGTVYVNESLIDYNAGEMRVFRKPEETCPVSPTWSGPKRLWTKAP